ncbi:leucine efflux protein LeuE [Gammaproteobacteria bacterium LSUCC0057]|uniref:Leucine efflux protein LeuE n=1 Tax=Gammaproteobacteria bacterium LSUCC0057 TaxID=2559237 RepID=A0A4Y8UFS8_9GAMM|nr:leucine efflux protein LeuE [Gammaproteobacteria bacterium LSUCC0057]
MAALAGITGLTTYILGTLFIVLLPGPNSLYVMSTASRVGWRQGAKGAAGVFCGDTLLMLMAVLGAASLLNSSPSALQFLQLLGACYLIYLGGGLLKQALAIWRGDNHTDGLSQPNATPKPNRQQPFRQALIISLLNPKAILFFVSFFVQFVAADAPAPLLSFLLLAIILQVISMLYLALLIFTGVRLAALFGQHVRVASAATALVGAAFIGFALSLMASA